MRFDLATLARRSGRRRSTALAVITPTQALADQLARVYMRVVKGWQAACTGRIIATYERETALRIELRRLTGDSAADVESAITGAGSDLTRLLIDLFPELEAWIVQVERWHRGRWTATALTATGIDLTTLIGPAEVRETLQDVLARNVALLKDVSAQTQGRISDVVFRGLRERRPAREVAKELRDAVAMSRGRSLRIASDQLSKLSASLDEERRRQAGIDEWVWRHSGKRHPRAEHLVRNGKHYTEETAPDDKPGQLPYCGCRAQAWLALD